MRVMLQYIGRRIHWLLVWSTLWLRRKRKRCKICDRRLWVWERHGLCRYEAVPTPLVVIKPPK